ERDHAGVPLAASQPDDGVDVSDLFEAERRPAAAGAVSAEVARIHGEPSRQLLLERDQPRLAMPSEEAMAEDQRDLAVAQAVAGQSDAVVGRGQEGFGRHSVAPRA